MWYKITLGLLLVALSSADEYSFTTTTDISHTTKLSPTQTGLIIMFETSSSLWGSMHITCRTSDDVEVVVPLTWEPSITRLLVIIQGKPDPGWFGSSTTTVLYSGIMTVPTDCGDSDLNAIIFTSNVTVNWGVCGGGWYCSWMNKASTSEAPVVIPKVLPKTVEVITTEETDVPATADNSEAVTQELETTTMIVTEAVTTKMMTTTATTAAPITAETTTDAEITPSATTNITPSEVSAITSAPSTTTASTTSNPIDCLPVKAQNTTTTTSDTIPVALGVLLVLTVTALWVLGIYTFRLRRDFLKLNQPSDDTRPTSALFVRNKIYQEDEVTVEVKNKITEGKIVTVQA